MGIFLFQGDSEAEQDFEAKWNISVSSDFEVKWDLSLSSDFLANWHIRFSTYADWTALYAVAPIGIDLFIPYSIRHEIEQEFEVFYHVLYGEVLIDTEVIWGVSLATNFLASYRMPKEVQIIFNTFYHILETSIETDFTASYTILSALQVESDFKAIWVIISFISEQIDNTASGVIAGESIEFFSIQLREDDDSYCITLSADVASIEDWSKCVPGEQIDITINGINFAMLLDSRKRTRAFAGSTYAIEGRSITAKLGKGFASPLTKTWEIDRTAREVIEELCLSVGISYLFELTDWLISANTLAAESIFPIEVIDKIAVAAGGIVQTKPDGTLIIRPRYPVPPPEYDTVVPVLSLSDVDDIFNIEEAAIVKPKWNAVRVMDEPETNKQYAIKQVEYNPVTKISIIAVTSLPFDSNIDLKFNHSNILGAVSVQYQGIVEKEVIETVEIVDGEGIVEWAVLSITNYDYLNNVDLGAVIPSNGAEIETMVIGQSIVKVTYKTRYHEFRVQDNEEEQVQVYVED